MPLLLLELAAVATTSTSGFLFAVGTIFVGGAGAAMGVVDGFDLCLVDVCCCCCFHDLCLSWPIRSMSGLKWFRSKRMRRLCRTRLCLCFVFG